MTSAATPYDPGLGAAAIGVGALVIALAVTSVALRFYTRLFTRLGLWWDDWLILAAVITTLVTSALVLSGNRIDPNGDGIGANADAAQAFTTEDSVYMKLAYASSILYFTIAGTTKLGILLMYIRIFYISDGFHAQVAVVSAIVMAYWIGCTVATLLTCRPMSYIWSTNSGYPQYCFNYNVFWMAAGVCELVLDFIILALPIRAVMRINLSPRRKLSVLMIFLLGSFVIVTGVLKVVFAYNPDGHIPLSGAAEVWVTLHAGLAIVCACLPILKPLFMRLNGTKFTPGTPLTNNGWPRPSEPDGWNVIHLSVENSTSDRSLYSDPHVSKLSHI